MAQRCPLMVGNWKMHGSLSSNAFLLTELKTATFEGKKTLGGLCDVAVCVPFPYLAQAQAMLDDTTIRWGAQDVSAHELGAYTGEVSASMLMDFDCNFAIVGHSERRSLHGEDDLLVVQKVQQLIAAGIVPIVCVGETQQERLAHLTESVVTRQLEAVLSSLTIEASSRIVIAYEPVWAIGTGVTATPKMAEAVHELLREKLAKKDEMLAKKVRILYGGSMKPENAQALLAMPNIDGGLIGGASLKAADFFSMIALATKRANECVKQA